MYVSPGSTSEDEYDVIWGCICVARLGVESDCGLLSGMGRAAIAFMGVHSFVLRFRIERCLHRYV